MAEEPSLGTSFLLLCVSMFVAILLFSNLFPNHWIRLVGIPTLGFVVYYLGASTYYYFVARAPEDDEATA